MSASRRHQRDLTAGRYAPGSQSPCSSDTATVSVPPPLWTSVTVCIIIASFSLPSLYRRIEPVLYPGSCGCFSNERRAPMVMLGSSPRPELGTVVAGPSGDRSRPAWLGTPKARRKVAHPVQSPDLSARLKFSDVHCSLFGCLSTRRRNSHTTTAPMLATRAGPRSELRYSIPTDNFQPISISESFIW